LPIVFSISFISNQDAIRQKVFLHNHRRKLKKQSISQFFAHKIVTTFAENVTLREIRKNFGESLNFSA
jgi:hypothetical protein